MDQKTTVDTSLDFQDFNLSASVKDSALADSAGVSRLSEDEDDLQGDIEQAKLLGDAEDSDSGTAGSSGNFLSFDFYRRYFDVSTAEVRQRCLWSMLPTPSRRLLADKLSSRPDLYGPFWICATLAVSIAVTGNLANYLQTASHGNAQRWKYDFHKLTLAGTVLFSYSWLIPVAMATLLWWRSVRIGVSMMQLISLYGYSLTVFVPISVICASGVSPVQWSAVLLGFALSGAVLAQNLWRAVTERGRNRRGGARSDEDDSDALSSTGLRRLGVIMISIVLLLHLALSAGFVLYFFRTALPPSVGGESTSTPVVTSAGLKPSPAVSGEATLDRHERTSSVHARVPEESDRPRNTARPPAVGTTPGGRHEVKTSSATTPEKNGQSAKTKALEQKPIKQSSTAVDSVNTSTFKYESPRGAKNQSQQSTDRQTTRNATT